MASKPEERLFIDTSRIKAVSLGGAKFWEMVVDNHTNFTWSFFLKSEDTQNKPIMQLLKFLEKEGKKFKLICCNNAGENCALEKDCADNQLQIKLKYTSANSPQYNGKVEQKFATIYARVRALLKDARLLSTLRSLLWCKAAKHMMLVENHLTTATKEIPLQIAMYCQRNPAFEQIHVFWRDVSDQESW